MKGIHNQNLDKPYHGCLGRMVNLFDFTTGLASNRLLTDKQHFNGSPEAKKSLPDVSRLIRLGDHMQNKMTVQSDSGRNCSKNKSIGTPIKVLIAREMSKEPSRSNPPSLVAKLMGLDALPEGKPNLGIQRSHSKVSSRSNFDMPLNQDKGYGDLQLEPELYKHPLPNETEDVYEIAQLPHNNPYSIQEKSLHKARSDEQSNDEMMALVREKFMEAKRLSIDTKLRQSPEFDDALEVLNANKDLFLKFLQEPNSMLSHHLNELRSLAPQKEETKKITVLRPRKIFDDSKLVNEVILPGLKPNKKRCQQTQIVDLKPQGIADAVSSPSLSPGAILEETEPAKSREFRKDITPRMCENSSSHGRDEKLFSSVSSNGYTGDESSLNDYDVEIMSPCSRNSWDYVNRVDSSYSMSSFSRVSYSLESSVCREAKKRLSERWATMTSIINHQDQRHVPRISSTLGEMLALSDTINNVDSKDSTLIDGSSSNKSKDIEKSHRRSKSDPVSGTNVDNLNDESKTNRLHETFKGRNSLKGKVSSLFFSGGKSNKRKPATSQSDVEARPFESCEIAYNSSKHYLNDSNYVTCSSAQACGSSRNSANPCVITSRVDLHVKDPLNCQEPSPISVLEIPSEEEGYTTESSRTENPEFGTSSKSIVIDKSITSTLSLDDSPVDTLVLYPSQRSLLSQDVVEEEDEEERECFDFVEMLLSMVGLNGEIETDMFMAKWHTFESPIDPSLRDKYFDLNEKITLQEAKRRRRRSTGKLVFDFVNSTLVEMAGYGSETCRRAIPCTGPHRYVIQDGGGGGSGGGSLTMVNQVCSQMNKWFSKEAESFFTDEFGDGNCIMVEMIVMKEVLGRGWMEHLILEMDNIGLGIELDLLEDLVQETFVEFTVKS